jgi:hypothetical protein
MKKKYTITAEGYGGEFAMGKVSPELVEKLQGEDIFPDEVVEAWHEIDDLEHISSCFEDTEFVVKDEDDEIVYQGVLDCSHTREAYTLECGHEGYTPVMQYMSSEKGFFFTAEFETDDFDVEKLMIKYVETDLGFFVEEMTYNGENLDLDFDYYDVRSKGFEAKVGWINPEWHDKEYREDE